MSCDVGVSASTAARRLGQSLEAREARRRDAADALHQRMVAYVHALADARPRSGVWAEHSYARPRTATPGAGAGAAPSGPGAPHVRVLLAEPPGAPELDAGALDVETLDPEPPEPPDASPAPAPLDDADADDDDDESAHGDDEWEARVAALAPGGAHARLADAAGAILRRLRLARLAGGRGPRGEDARAAARRLRHALAGGWAAPGAPQQRPPAWLHSALRAHLPRDLRPLYEEVADELRRAAPRLAERLAACRAAPAATLPDRGAAEEAADAGEGPVLAWLRTGRDRLEDRWERRFRALLPTRPLDVRGTGAAPPEAWCATAAGAARAALADLLASLGERDVVVGGVGGGAAACAAALGGASTVAGRVRGALLLAPALLTAEGGRDAPDDPLGEVRVPLLLVVGAAAGDAARGAARLLAAQRRAAPRRLVEVRGADRLLRLPHAARRRLALSQRALDAAIADECARWAAEVAEGGAREQPEPEEYAHLPAPGEAAWALAEGRSVARVAGRTPLALVPPGRPPPLAAADILRLPIVFADDERAAPAKYARVIVAKRGRAGRAGAARPAHGPVS